MKMSTKAGLREYELLLMDKENLEDLLNDDNLPPFDKAGAAIRLYLTNSSIERLYYMLKNQLVELDIAEVLHDIETA